MQRNTLPFDDLYLRHRVDSNHHKDPCETLPIQFGHNATIHPNKGNDRDPGKQNSIRFICF